MNWEGRSLGRFPLTLFLSRSRFFFPLFRVVLVESPASDPGANPPGG
jgi:hypothetical protein